VDFALYLVTDRHQAGGRSLQEVVSAALRAGVRAVQLREKDLPTRPLLGLARELTNLARSYGARMLVNDRADICLAAGSDGTHLPAAGHSADEAARAETEGADFIVLGPIFETPSKLAFGPPIGLGELERARMRCRVPLFGIGGVTAARVREVVKAGAHGVAVVGSVMAADDVERAARDLLTALDL
jgi:thiamine-phosphate pyrophosphorylase